MTYTVKNGTWCKDNEKEYYSATETGLKAALKAGEITSGTRVVVHKPKYHAGQLIQSLNPECPEGCFVPHGQSFDTGIYEELAKVFPDGKLPDLRECVLVCAGQNEHITTHEHDVFNAGEFKDDCAAAGDHTHTITINDPGHGHSVSDPGHSHSVSDPGHGHTISDPGHGHTISDPGHDHGRGTYEITGKVKYIGDSFNDNAIASGAFEKEQGYNINTDAQYEPAPSNYGALNFTASKAWTGRSEKVGTGVSIDSNTTGVSIGSNTTGVSIGSNTTDVSIGSNTTGVSIGSNTTGITAECSSDGASGANVTRTKQYGVYYYIAF